MNRTPVRTDLATLRGALLASVAFTGIVGLVLTASLGGASANPLGGKVVAGAATIGETGNTLDVTQSTNKAIIDWRSFSIAPQEAVRFLQPNSKAITLNRVTGAQESVILGSLSANGNVILVNPNGVFIGAGASIDVSGLVATTANITDANFMKGAYVFDQASSNADASVVNEGSISIRDSGLAALVAPSVRNSGTISAKLGKVALGGAETFTLDMYGDGLISFDASSAVKTVAHDADGKPVAALVVNTGEISAEGGSVNLSARAAKGVVDNVINTDGVIRATSIKGVNGKIVLSGGDEGAVNVGGTLDASGTAKGQTGGKVAVTGKAVSVKAGARLTASGSVGGGTVTVGGDSIKSGALADSVTVAAGASLTADAIDSGNGGTVKLLSGKLTTHAGSISARGGAKGGNGGFVEVSSVEGIDLTGAVDTSAARGQAGTFLIDPTNVTIATTAGVNVVTVNSLEAYASNSNIVVDATGRISVEASLDLATGTGHSVTLRSTTTGGIVFSDGVSITTHGGDIVLKAEGLGSGIGNVGALTTGGGNVTMIANGDITLAGAIDAGTGSVSMLSVAGSIANAAATASSAVVKGRSVTLSASSANVGSAARAIYTDTADLEIWTGGNLAVANAATLTDLAITSVHTSSTAVDSYSLASTGLTFAVTDSTSGYAVTSIVQSGLDLTLTGDRTLALGTIDVGSGSLSLTSTAGALTGSGGTLVTAGALSLRASGTTGTNGAIGTAGQAINTAASSLVATAGSAGVFVANVGTLSSLTLTASGTSAISSTAGITVGAVTLASNGLTLSSSAGSIVDDGVATTTIAAGSLTLSAGGSVGTGSVALKSSATNVTASSSSGGVHLSLTSAGTTTLTSVTSTDGNIDISAAGTIYATSLSSANGTSSITLTTGGTYLSVGAIDAGSGDVTLTNTTASGYFTKINNNSLITAGKLTINATSAISSSINLNTAVSELDFNVGGGYASITQTGDIQLDAATFSSQLLLTASGSISIAGSISATGSLFLTSTGGSITTTGAGNLLTAGSSIWLSASHGALGQSGASLKTKTVNLILSSGGDIYLDNAVALASLEVTANHAGAGGNAYSVTSPYLNWVVTDDGSAISLTKLVAPTMSTLVFSTDRNLIVGKVTSASTATLTSTAGNIVDDGSDNTRVSSGAVTLDASAGNIGSGLASTVDVATSQLVLRSGGDIYVGDSADLASLNVTSTHVSAAANYHYVVTAPQLTWNVTDSADGYAFNTLTDVTSLSFSFSGDRTLTVNNINLTRNGNLSLTSTTGSIVGSAAALSSGHDERAVAAAISLFASAGAIGSAADPLRIATDNITSQSATGTTVTVARPVSASSRAVNVYSYGMGSQNDITLIVEQGDIMLNYLSGRTVDVSAGHGSILSGQVSASTITLAADGSIGSSSSAITVYGNASTPTVTAHATHGLVNLVNTTVYGTTVGAISAGTSIAINSTYGIVDDGDAATRLSAPVISLTSGYGPIGSAGAALQVSTPSLTLTGYRSMVVDDDQALGTLALTSTGSRTDSAFSVTATGLTLTMSDTGSLFTLSELTSAAPLQFSLSSQHAIAADGITNSGGSVTLAVTSSGNLTVGAIDTGATGTVTLSSSSGSIFAGASELITAATVSLTAGNGSIGTSTASIGLSGTTALSTSAGSNIYVTDDTALASLSLASTSSSSTANLFSVTATGLTLDITDDGSNLQTLTSVAGTDDFSFTSTKSIAVGSVAANNSVSLVSSSSRNTGNKITQTATGSGVTADAVTLTATNANYTDTSFIGTGSKAVDVDASSLNLTTAGNLYVAAGSTPLTALSITTVHRTRTTGGATNQTPSYVYSLTGGGLASFSITDAAYQTTLTNIASSGDMDFSFTGDHRLAVGTIDAGSSTTGSITLKSNGSRSSAAGNPSIVGTSGSNSLTAGSITLDATGYGGYIGAGVTPINTVASHLTLRSDATIYVANSGALASLSAFSAMDTGYLGYNSSPTGSITWSGGQLAYGYNSSYGMSINTATGLSGMDLGIGASGGIYLNTAISTGAGTGSVEISAGGTILAPTTATRITTGALTLNANNVSANTGNGAVGIDVTSLAGTVSSSATLSNAGSLAIGDFSAQSANITSGGSITATGAISGTSLTLTANGSIGTSGAAMATSVRDLTLVASGDIYVDNSTDLALLSVTDNSTAANTFAVTASQLTFDVTDDGSEVTIHDVSDLSGVDFSLTSVEQVGITSIDAKNGRSVSVQSTGGAIVAAGSMSVIADTVSLTAATSLGTSSASLKTTAQSLTLGAGADIYADNSLDLSALALDVTNSTTGVYAITSGAAFGSATPTLSFTGSNGASTTIDAVSDTTGISFSAASSNAIVVGSIDATASGSTGEGGAVSLSSSVGIGRSGPTSLITAASLTLDTDSGADVGAVAAPLRVSSQVITAYVTGSLYLTDLADVDTLSISDRGSATSTFAIDAPDMALAASTTAGMLTLTSASDSDGLAFGLSSSTRSLTIGSLDLGQQGTVSLGSSNGSVLDDGTSSKISAASLSISAQGAIGSATTGYEIDAEVAVISASSSSAGVAVGLVGGGSTVSNISGHGDIYLSKDAAAGDIALGSISADGHAATIINAGGSILSGSLYEVSAVTLDAAGSIGNDSAVYVSRSSSTVDLTATAATNARGATGSVAIDTSATALNVTSITAPGTVTLTNSYGNIALNGSISAGGGNASGATTITTGYGNITGSAANNIIADRVTLAVTDSGIARSIGSVSQSINVATTDLAITAPVNIYVADSLALQRLSIDRTSYVTAGAGVISLSAAGQTYAMTDTGSATTITNVAASAGLDFSFVTADTIVVGTIDTGSSGSVYLNSGTGNSNSGTHDGGIIANGGSSLITTGALDLRTSDYNYSSGTSSIGTSSQSLNVAATSVTATAGKGGIYLAEAGSINLTSLTSGGALKVTTTSGGDITIGSLSYGNGADLTLTAAGSIFSGGATITASSPSGGGSYGAIRLSAAHGIGTADAAIQISAPSGGAVSAEVTGSGDLYLSTGAMPGGISAATADGSINIVSSSSAVITSAVSSTDSADNGISIRATSGNLTFGTISAGGSNGATVSLDAAQGHVLSSSSSSSVSAYAVSIVGGAGVGDSNAYGLNASGQRVSVISQNGSIVLTPSATATLSYVATNGGTITVTAGGDLYAGNIISNGGTITLNGGAHVVRLGNVDASNGSVTVTTTGAGTLVDDDLAETSVIGGTVSLTGASGIGTAQSSIGTDATTLNLASTSGGIYVSDVGTNGVTLASVTSGNGAIAIDTAGATTVTNLVSSTDSAGNNVAITVAHGDLSVASISAGTAHALVSLTAEDGGIRSSGSGTNVTAYQAALSATDGIGTLTDFASGTGTPLSLAVSSITGLASTDDNSTINIREIGNLSLASLSGVVLGDGGALRLSATGNLDASSFGASLGGIDLSLEAGGTLTIASGGFSTSGALVLSGGTDIISAGASPHHLTLGASSIVFTSGAASGSVDLSTTTGALDASLTNASGTASLTVGNTGALSDLALATTYGNVAFTNSTGFTISSLSVGGSSHTASLTATTGDIGVGSVNVGSTGTLNLTATTGGIATSGSSSMTAGTLNLTSHDAIGSLAHAFEVASDHLSATVLGSGNMFLAVSGGVSLDGLTTHGGNISVTGPGMGKTLATTTGITTGGTGTVTLSNVGGIVSIGNSIDAASLIVAGDTVSLAALNQSGTIAVTGATTLNGDVTAASFGVTGTLSLSGNRTIDTHGVGGTISVSGAAIGDGHALVVNAGAGTVSFGSSLSGLSTFTVTGAQIATHGVSTTGAQIYNGAASFAGGYSSGTADTTINNAASLAADANFVGGTVRFLSTLDGAYALSVNGDVAFGSVVGSATALTSLGVTGTTAMNAGSVRTTGGQSYGDVVTLGRDTMLTASLVTFGDGVEATTAGGQSLVVNGDVGQARFGSLRSLHDLTISGAVTLGQSVTTTGSQSYGGAVTLTHDVTLTGTTAIITGSVSGVGHALTFDANAVIAGPVEVASLLANGTATLGAAVTSTGAQVYAGAVTVAGTATLSALSVGFQSTVDGTGDLAVTTSGGDIAFAGAVGSTTRLGSLSVSTDSGHAARFVAASSVATAGDFRQTGSGRLVLPSTISVSTGSISFAGIASLADGAASIGAGGSVSMTGLLAANTALTMTTGGAMNIGVDDLGTDDKLVVKSLTVPAAGSAQLFGSINGTGGFPAARLVDSRLVGPPYYMNTMPWGPVDVINDVVSTVVVVPPVPSSSSATSLFTGQTTSTGIGPDALGAYRSPNVLTVATGGGPLTVDPGTPDMSGNSDGNGPDDNQAQ